MTELETLHEKRLVAGDKLRRAERTFESMSQNYLAARVSLTSARQVHQNLLDQIRLVNLLEETRE